MGVYPVGRGDERAHVQACDGVVDAAQVGLCRQDEGIAALHQQLQRIQGEVAAVHQKRQPLEADEPQLLERQLQRDRIHHVARKLAVIDRKAALQCVE